MASTYENDLRLEEMATGENSGSWGTKTNTNLELIADAFSYGTETIANADTTITIADGAADAARSLALKINSSADLTTTRTITLAPNTTSKVWIIENNTSGGQTLTISAGSGSNVTLANGTTKIIATDGIGAGSNVVELTQDLAIADMSVDGILSLADGSNSAPSLTNTGDTNTGLYFPAADEVGITTGGTQRVKVDSTGVDITGTLVSDGLTVDGDGTFSATNPTVDIKATNGNDASLILMETTGNDFGANGANGFRSRYDGGDNALYIQSGAETTIRNRIKVDRDTGDITFYDTDGTTASFVYDASAGTTFNEAGADRDFRVEGDTNTHMLFVDAGNDRVAIGTSTTTEMFNVGGSMELRSTSINLDFMETGVTDANFRLRQNTGNFFLQKLTDDKATSTEYYRADGGAGNIFNDNSVNIDFRVESDGQAHMLFVDASTNRVGINNNVPQAFLHVTSGDATPLGSFRVEQTNASAGGNSWQSLFEDDSSADQGSGNSIIYINSNRPNTSAGKILRVVANSKSSEYFSIYDTGEVVVNESSLNTADFRVESDSQSIAFQVDAGTGEINTNTYGFNIYNYDDGPNLNVSSGRDYNSLMMGAAANYGSNNSAENKWSWNWRGRGAASTTHYNFLYDEIGNQEYFRVQADALQKAVVVNDGSNDIDFRVESNSNTHAIFLDAANNKIGISDSSPSYTLDIRQNTNDAFDGVNLQPNNQTQNMQYSFIGMTNTYFTEFMVDSADSGTTGYRYFKFYEGTRDNNGELLYLGYNGTVFNEGGADRDFRVESDNDSSAIFVDAGADSVALRQHKFAATPTSTNNDFVHFNTGTLLVNQGASQTANLFIRSASGSAVPCAGTAYVSCEASGQNVSWSYIIDFFYSNNTFTTTARATGNSQSTTTCSVQENGAGVSVTVAYAGGLGGNMKFNASGFANVGNY